MWLLPSYGRPEALRKLLDAPGGWPSTVTVLVNEDDPEADRYFQIRDHLFRETGKMQWAIHFVQAGARFADAVGHYFIEHPDKPFYGIIDDDYWPVTPGWWENMEEAAGEHYIALANNLKNFPKPYCCRAMGGELARAIGTIAPGTMRHNYSDDAWGKFAEDFGLLRPLEHVIVEHRHHLFGGSKPDATYARGSNDIKEDALRYKAWLGSDDRRHQCERVAKLLGRSVSILDPKSIRLVVASPTHFACDPIYHHSMAKLQIECIKNSLHLVELGNYGASHIAKARERALWDAWSHNPTHILFIDSDMGFNPRDVIRLLLADVDFACAVGVRKEDNLSLCCNFFSGDLQLHPVNQFLKIKDVGFAFCLLKRSVIERMVEAYPDLAYNGKDGKTEHALFLDMIDNRERLGEDYSFCRRWTAIGGEIWADRRTSLIHAGRKEYTGSIDDFLQGKTDVTLNVVDRKGE